MPELPYNGPLSCLISKRLVEELREESTLANWTAFVSTVKEQLMEYPDGSLEFFHEQLSTDQVESLNRLRTSFITETNAKRSLESREVGAEGFQTNFRGILPTPRRNYELWYPDEAQRGLGDKSLLVLPGDWNEVTSNEKNPESLIIAILMQRRPTEESRNHVVHLIAQWFAGVSVAGINGEGPVRPNKDSIEWRGRAAFLSVNFSQSGQFTLNWFILWMINHTDAHPIEMFIFGNPDSEWLAASMKQKPVHQSLPKVSNETAIEPLEVGSSLSGAFEIIREPSFTAERAILEISFVESASEEHHKFIESAVQAWLLVGSLGGYGGRFSYHSEIEWNSEFTALKFQIDLTMANLEVSMNVLRRMVGEITQEVLQVEAISLR